MRHRSRGRGQGRRRDTNLSRQQVSPPERARRTLRGVRNRHRHHGAQAHRGGAATSRARDVERRRRGDPRPPGPVARFDPAIGDGLYFRFYFRRSLSHAHFGVRDGRQCRQRVRIRTGRDTVRADRWTIVPVLRIRGSLGICRRFHARRLADRRLRWIPVERRRGPPNWADHGDVTAALARREPMRIDPQDLRRPGGRRDRAWPCRRSAAPIGGKLSRDFR